ncbi:MAG TPA: hypothetical protein VHO48_00955 [Anaerolineaceae bacterium]|nr:hypothetical protein [Anaerolineaceae bacterium]
MNEILRFLEAIEVWIYAILGLVGLFYLRKFLLALSEWRGAVFGLERDNAQHRLSEATSVLALMLLIGVGEFLLVSFVAPTFPGVNSLPTPTLDVLSTATATLAAGQGSSAEGTPAPTSVGTPVVAGDGCVAGQLNFTVPKPGDNVSGKVVLKGVITVPDFGYYKYEYTPVDQETWVTIAAGNNVTQTPEPDGSDLGEWDTSAITPGDYLLRLVVTDHQGTNLPACIIPIRIAPAQ